jgi:hypothetical protein
MRSRQRTFFVGGRSLRLKASLLIEVNKRLMRASLIREVLGEVCPRHE